MRILIACEFSGIVREAFAAHGHDAWSCDLLPSDRAGTHITGDVLEVLDQGWDLMIAHPPCTHLAVSGAAWFARKQIEQAEALAFVERLWAAPIRQIALENPVSVISTRSSLGKPTQIIQPWMFGHCERKTTCLWLKGLPRLIPISDLRAETEARPKSQQNPLHYLGPSPDRWKLRSLTYEGIAHAMAAQWGGA